MPATCRLVLYVIGGEVFFGTARQTLKAVAPEDGYPRGLARTLRKYLMSTAAADERRDERRVVVPCARVGVVLVGIIRHFMASAGAPREPHIAGVRVLFTHRASLEAPSALRQGTGVSSSRHARQAPHNHSNDCGTSTRQRFLPRRLPPGGAAQVTADQDPSNNGRPTPTLSYAAPQDTWLVGRPASTPFYPHSVLIEQAESDTPLSKSEQIRIHAALALFELSQLATQENSTDPGLASGLAALDPRHLLPPGDHPAVGVTDSALTAAIEADRGKLPMRLHQLIRSS